MSPSMNKKVTSFKLIFRGRNVSKEDKFSQLPNFTFEPEVESETSDDNVETEFDSGKNGNVETDVRFGKNLVYTRNKNIPESTHI